MTQEHFDKWIAGEMMRVVWERGTFGKAIELLQDDYIVLETQSGNHAYPIDQLEWY